MNLNIIKQNLEVLIKEQKDGQINSKDAYIILAERMNLTEEQLKKSYTNTKGHSKSKFKVKVQAAVEALRKEGVLQRGSERGIWILIEK